MAQVHVLVGAGDDVSRRLREAQLRTAGCRVSLARTGFEAIVKASCHVPDLILLDDSLGDIDAAETGRLIATCPVTSHIPVVRLGSGRPRLPRRVLTIVRQAAL
jgi:CheY-like chemotaxis protein